MTSEMVLQRKDVISEDQAARMTDDAKYCFDVLQDGLDSSAEGLLMAARAMAIADSAGHEIPSRISKRMVGYLRKIARQDMLPEVLIALDWAPSLMRTVSKYPIEDQKTVAEGKPIPVVVMAEGGWTEKPYCVEDMSQEHRKQVFGRDGLRNTSAQSSYLESAKTDRHVKAIAVTSDGIRVDKKLGGIYVPTPSFIPAADLATYLGKLAG